jgi:hypothetical protein
MVFSQQWFMPSYKAGFAEDTATAILYPAFGEIDLKQGDSSRSYLHRKMFMENFIGLQKEGLVLALNPLMNFYGGTSSRKENIIYRNTRAIQIKGALGKHVAFKTSFYETQMNSPEWIDGFYRKFGVFPGETNAKGYGEDGYDIGSVYSAFAVHQSWGKMRMVFRGGYDNLFIGTGFRSLFLSDFSLPFLHGAMHLQYGRWQYLHLTASLQNPNFRNVMQLETSRRPSTAPYQKKTMTLHYLRYRLAESVSLGLLEGVIFRVADSAERRFSMQYLNPVIFSNVAAYGLNHNNNVMIGADMHISWSIKFTTYLQWLQDTKNSEGTAVLASVRYRGSSFKALVEGSHLGNEVLAHRDPRQSYTHFNQPLTHPAGAGVDELVIEAGYRYQRFIMDTRVVIQQKRHNVDYNIPTEVTGETIHHTFYDATLRYILNPSTRLQLFANILEYHGPEGQEQFFRIGLKTQLRREYMAVTE